MRDRNGEYMEESNNIWNTKPSGIEITVIEALKERVARHGGQLVDQAITRLGRSYLARDGHVIEVVDPYSADGCVYLAVIGGSVSRRIPLARFRHLGAEESVIPTAAALRAAVARDCQLDSEVDALIDDARSNNQAAE